MKIAKLLSLLPFLLIVFNWGCSSQESVNNDKLIVGVVGYGDSELSLERYQRFQNYLAEQTKTPVELEVAYNELKAVEEIERSNWDIVFASPGLAAIANKQGYVQMFPLETRGNAKFGLIVTRADSTINQLSDLQDKIIALGERGSASGYYLPLYDLYGLTLQEVRFAPTPESVMAWVEDGTVDAGALSETDFDTFKAVYGAENFRILQKSRAIPPGVVLMGQIERNQSEFITRVMREAPSNVVSDAKYLPNANLPNYEYFFQIVDKVRPLEERISQQPATLTIDRSEAESRTE
ncbi:phosphate/phosphite/phosphonate ABC transporter substrate-binding protein [Romeria aff. gracilis LEGE 07310]|uniref:Phosphate/phosphite/phosphonate ABC transporter substrate-binding protein n=1 Tax=Vasconcelosia minhoensis LEGE 07310 TaxID=915328 RepID=A0A8J7A4H2_9CYAN|nr:phosphate/phosphite/phosphonate ABC transporter substrate-binding protein [Romeria aff. gracilis LEGE 07310]